MSRTIDIPISAPEPVRAGMWGKWREAFARIVRNAVEERFARCAAEELNRLDDRMLRDIGIARSEIDSCIRWGRGKRPHYRPAHADLPPKQPTR